MSLAQYFLYEDSIKDAAFSNGACALTSRIDEQRFLAVRVPQEHTDNWVTVHTYRLTPGSYCKPLSSRVAALVHVIQPKLREQKMVQVSADEMAGALTADGSIALYGVYFDTDQAQIKPDSAATLQEIAALLQQHANLKLLVVGHTDNQGDYAHNLSLSDRLAQAVKAALEQQFGIAPARLTAAGAGMLAPVASNDTEAGRAKNRRVALVKLQ
ncbi:OmpA family protein [Pseudomonas sp. NCCP-436]|uniref:OmpA family protein n=1 Tax=Pseudomonas sp. NCCP-436 TaxID=2842481 RepID=UPI001C826B94|nr:OmpA family protein [Pseudomonas sp. NCCP-436]GIZ12942.1 hypothetical protein NCCP436_23580 [Pseudomonas sp. NCCP-436]